MFDRLTAMTLLVAALAAGCGGGSGESASGTRTPGTASTATPATEAASAAIPSSSKGTPPTSYQILSKFLDSFQDGAQYRWTYLGGFWRTTITPDTPQFGPEGFGTVVTRVFPDGTRQLQVFDGTPGLTAPKLDLQMRLAEGKVALMRIDNVTLADSSLARTHVLNLPVDGHGYAEGELIRHAVGDPFAVNAVLAPIVDAMLVRYSVDAQQMCLSVNSYPAGKQTIRKYCFSSDLQRGAFTQSGETYSLTWQNTVGDLPVEPPAGRPTGYQILTRFLNSFQDGANYRWDFGAYNFDPYTVLAPGKVTSISTEFPSILSTFSNYEGGFRRLRFFTPSPIGDAVGIDMQLTFGNGYITSMRLEGVDMPQSAVAGTYALNAPVDDRGYASGELWRSERLDVPGAATGPTQLVVNYQITPEKMCLHRYFTGGDSTIRIYCWSGDLSRGSFVNGDGLGSFGWQNYPFTGNQLGL